MAEAIGQASVKNTTTTTIASGDKMVSSALPDNGENKKTAKRQNEAKLSTHIIYNPKKPKWWNRLGNNGRDATKSQKRAMRKVLDGEGIDSSNAASQSSGLRLPPVPYGTKLDWDEIFPNSIENNRDIWLELGFGRGENLQALLESKLWQEQNENECQNDCDNADGRNNYTIRGDEITRDAHVARQRQPRKFHLVGAEVSGVGIGCLCKRIEQLQNELQQNSNVCDDHFVLYRPEMDPYSSGAGGNAIATPMACEEKLDGCNPTNGNQVPWKEQRTSLANSYGDRFRIHTGDGYKLLPKLPDGSLSAILITFPDPFPKDSDVNYRLVQHQTLLECHRILRKGRYSNTTNGIGNDDYNNKNGYDWNGRLFLATDHDGYHEWCHKIMSDVNESNQDNPSSSSALFEIEETCPDRMEWLPAVSRYEQKGWDEGRSTKLTCWVAI